MFFYISFCSCNFIVLFYLFIYLFFLGRDKFETNLILTWYITVSCALKELFYILFRIFVVIVVTIVLLETFETK